MYCYALQVQSQETQDWNAIGLYLTQIGSKLIELSQTSKNNTINIPKLNSFEELLTTIETESQTEKKITQQQQQQQQQQMVMVIIVSLILTMN